MVVLAAIAALVGVMAASASAASGGTTRVSVDSSGAESNHFSSLPSVSSDGRFVAFESEASNLVPNDTNGRRDVFIHDRQGGTTELVGVNSAGVQANSGSSSASISADGRYVAFYSDATNMTDDPNQRGRVFVRDVQLGTTELISVNNDGFQAGYPGAGSPSISADGSYVAFVSSAPNLVMGDTNGVEDIFVRDRQGRTTERVSLSGPGAEANNWSFGPSISSDGNYVAFLSAASNLVTTDTNGTTDIFVRDRQGGTTERVSVSSSGAEANNSSYSEFDTSISSDGRYVAFESLASNLVPDDTNDNGGTLPGRDVFVRDRQLGTTDRVSVDSSGAQTNNDSRNASISSDGRYVAFESQASNLVSGDTNLGSDIFVHDLQVGTTERVSVDSSGAQANNQSYKASISPDGHHVAFESDAFNLVSGDTNGRRDIFVHDMSGATNAPPVASDDSSYTTGEGQPLNVGAPGVLANDTDPEGATLTALKVTDPAHGTLTLNADGSFTYTPNAGFIGNDSFTYKANDGSNDSNVATVTITVRDITAPTVTSVTPAEEQQGVSLTNPIISATFSEAMDPSTLNSTTFKLDRVKRSRRGDSVLENNVPASVNYDPNTMTARLSPNSSLVGASWYRVTVTTGAKDLAGNALATQKVWYFKTARR